MTSQTAAVAMLATTGPMIRPLACAGSAYSSTASDAINQMPVRTVRSCGHTSQGPGAVETHNVVTFPNIAQSRDPIILLLPAPMTAGPERSISGRIRPRARSPPAGSPGRARRW